MILLLIGVRPWLRRWAGSRATAGLWWVAAACLLVPWPSVWQWNAPPGWSDAAEVSSRKPTVRISVELAGGGRGGVSQPSNVSSAGRPPLQPAGRWRLLGFDLWNVLWLGGIVLAAAPLFAGWVRTRRWAARTIPAAEGSLPARVFAALPEHCRRDVALRLTDALEVPALAGVWRPQVWLPHAWATALDAEELRHVLLHELGHACRRDLLAQWTCSLACCLHWFNPLVWTLAAMARTERELACDAWVLARGDSGGGEGFSSAYGRTLIRIASRMSVSGRSPLAAVAMATGRTPLGLRVREIGAFRPVPRWRGVGLGMLAVAAAAALATGRAAAPPADGGSTPGPTTAESSPSPGAPTRHGVMADPVPPERRASIPADRLGLEFESKTVAFTTEAIRQLKAQANQSTGVSGLLDQLAASVAEKPTDADAKPAGFAISCVLSDQDFQQIIRRFNQCDGVDLLSAPRVTAKPLQKATVEIIREFQYAKKFSRQNGPDGKPTLTPTEFDKKNLGITLTMSAELSPARDAVDFDASWQDVELQGFVRTSDGKPIATADYKNDDERPVFSTQTLETVVTMPPGSTLVLGKTRRQPGFGAGLPIGEKLKVEATVLTFITVNVVESAGMVGDAAASPSPGSGVAGTPPDAADADGKELPYGVPVPGKPGYVTSPYAPDAGYVDLRGFKRDEEVRDPYTSKLFRVP